jgi:hypothetical protein
MGDGKRGKRNMYGRMGQIGGHGARTLRTMGTMKWITGDVELRIMRMRKMGGKNVADANEEIKEAQVSGC